jgi:hypothetical protein
MSKPDGLLAKCCNDATAPADAAAIKDCIGAATAWNELDGDNDLITTCSANGYSLPSGSGTTSKTCNAIKTSETCFTMGICPKPVTGRHRRMMK